jgi:hypothetical protein
LPWLRGKDRDSRRRAAPATIATATTAAARVFFCHGAAWSYINKEGNASKYSSDDLKKVNSRIKRAYKRLT